MRTGWLLLLALAWPALAKRSFAKNVDERDFWLGIGIGGGLGLLGLLAAVFCTCLAERWEEKNIESTNSEELYGTDEDYERDGTGGTGTEESD